MCSPALAAGRGGGWQLASNASRRRLALSGFQKDACCSGCPGGVLLRSRRQCSALSVTCCHLLALDASCQNPQRLTQGNKRREKRPPYPLACAFPSQMLLQADPHATASCMKHVLTFSSHSAPVSTVTSLGSNVVLV